MSKDRNNSGGKRPFSRSGTGARDGAKGGGKGGGKGGYRGKEQRPFRDRKESGFKDGGFKDKSSGEKTFKDKPFKDKPFKDKPFKDKPFRDKPFKDKPRGDKPFRDRPYGDRPRGKRHEDRAAAPAGPKIRANMWGTHAVREAWLNPNRTITAFYVTEQALEGFQDTLAAAREAGLDRPDPVTLDRKALDRALGDAVHQGLAIDAAPFDEIFVFDLAVKALEKDSAVLIILDQVTDPHNVGAILRSASAFGASGVIMQTRHAPEVTGVLAKSACGAVEHVPIAYETNLSRALQYLQGEGFRAIGLDERGTDEIAALTKHPRTVLVLGAEGKGLRQGLREHCDTLVRLPTGGPIATLNVSNAAAVALYALVT